MAKKNGVNQTINSIVTAIGMIAAVVFGMNAADSAELITYLGAIVGGIVGIIGLIKSYQDEKEDADKIDAYEKS